MASLTNYGIGRTNLGRFDSKLALLPFTPELAGMAVLDGLLPLSGPAGSVPLMIEEANMGNALGGLIDVA
jgi:hypothetical protein